MKSILILCLALLFPAIAVSDHKVEGTEVPITACFNHVKVYKQMAIVRRAGLTLDEALESNGYTMRLVTYITEQQELNVLDLFESLESIQAKARVIYEIPEEDFINDEFLIEWATAQFDTCITEIPGLSLVPDEAETKANERMLPAE